MNINMKAVAAVSTVLVLSGAVYMAYRMKRKLTDPDTAATDVDVEVVVETAAAVTPEVPKDYPDEEFTLDLDEISLTPGDDANRLFESYWSLLNNTGHHHEWFEAWGRPGRGYAGLMKSSPFPGVWCTSDPLNGKVIYRSDKRGVTCIVYQLDGSLLYNAHEKVEVLFSGVVLTADDIGHFVNDTHKAA